jgi:phosphatidylinositol alpha-1,6-mannosyltransferase
VPRLFVSPCLCQANFGGVQLSGRIARDRLARESGQSLRCLYYGNAPGIQHGDDCSSSRFQAARKALMLRGAAGDVLFWHVGMLKFLPALGRRGRKIHLFLHGIECWRSLEPLTQYLLGDVDSFLTNSSFTWNRFIEKNPRWAKSTYQIVPLGLGAPDPVSASPAPVPAALILGRMQKGEGYKGHEQVIRSWPQVRQRVPAAELWIAGGGSLEPELKAIAAQAGQDDHIRFFGVITEEQKQRLIGEARCLALPSKGEGFGLVYLEAMRRGRPCLASNVDAGREVVGPSDGGLCVNPDDASALSDALVRLLSSGAEWQRWSSAAKARYESRFTAAHFQDRFVRALHAADPAAGETSR